MLVAIEKRRWSVSSLPRSQVRDLYSSFGSFFACLMSALTTVWVSLPATLANITYAFGARLRARCRCCSVRTADRPPNGQAPPDLQPQPVADGLRRHPSYVPVYRHSDQPVWSDASSASIEDGKAALS